MERFFFRIADESPQAGHYLATAATVGPWSDQLQHGGPPGALAVRAAERLVEAETGRSDLVALRLAAEFAGPTPVGDVHARASIVRAARSAVLVEVVLRAAARDCLHARVWLLRAVPGGDGSSPATGELAGPRPELPGLSSQWSFGYADHIEWRVESGDAVGPGPAAVWARPRVPLVAGERPSSLQLAALIGDSASGISAELSWQQWSFLNVDLDIHLSRPLGGEWLRMDAVTQLGGQGAAVARSTLGDARGVVGGGLQTLLVQRLAG